MNFLVAELDYGLSLVSEVLHSLLGIIFLFFKLLKLYLMRGGKVFSVLQRICTK